MLVLKNDGEKGSARVRLNNKIMSGKGLLIGDWVEVSLEKASFLCTCFPLKNSFFSDYIELDDSIVVNKEGEVQFGTNISVDFKKLKNICEAEEVAFDDITPKKQLEESEEELKSRVVGMVVKDGNIVFERYRVKIGGKGGEKHYLLTEYTWVTILKRVKNEENVEKQEKKEEKKEEIHIGGLRDAVESVEEMLIFPILYRRELEELGSECVKGVLLHGPTGCGKGLLVKSLCQKHGIKVVNVMGTDLNKNSIGGAEKYLRKIFEKAEKESKQSANKAVVIFLDSIEAICPKRNETDSHHSRIVAQLLTLMDGTNPMKSGIVIIGATSDANLLDPALRRAGRFEREIEISIPNKEERAEILSIHTKKLSLSDDVNLLKLAEITVGYVGADLQALCREASLIASKRRDSAEGFVKSKDFFSALKVVTASSMRSLSVEFPKTSWDDVGGLEEIKSQIKEATLWPMQYKETFQRFKVKSTRGILLYGPEGTGLILYLLSFNFF